MLAGEAQRLAILLVVVKHVALIALEHRARHFHWLGETALRAPVEEETDVHTAALERVLGVVPHPQIFEMLFQQRG